MRFLLGIIALFIIPGSAIALWDAFITICNHKELWIPLLLGFATGIPLYFTLIRKVSVISTFEHEFTHAIVALLFLRRIHKFIVTKRQGGQVEYSGNFGGEFGTLMIGMAPYYLPTFTLIAVLVRPFLSPAWFPWFDGFIGATLAFHIFSTSEETKLSWTKRTFTGAGDNQKTRSDIGKVGYIFAFLVILGFGLFLMGLVLQLIASGYSGTWHFLKLVMKSSWSVYKVIILKIWWILVPLVNRWLS